MRPRLLARSAAVVLVVVGVATTAAVAEDAVTLRLRPQPDVSYAYVLTQDQDAEITMGAFGSQKTSTRTRMDLRERLVDRSDDSVTMELVYDRVRIEATALGQTTTFDSESTGPDGGGEGGVDALSRIVGRPVRFTATERAIVTDVDGFDAWFDAMASGEEDTDPAVAPMIAMLKQSFGDEAMGQMLQQGLPVLPEDAVAPGATWRFTLDMSNPAVGTMGTHQEFELEGFEERDGRACARVALAMTMEHDGEFPILDRLRETFSAQGQQVDLAIELGTAEGTATLWLDLATGMPVAMESEMRLDMVMNLTAPDVPDAPPGGAMEMRMSTAVRQNLALVGDRSEAESSKILD